MGRGHIPMGYKIIEGKAVIDEEEAKVVREMFLGYLEGKSLTKVVKDMGLEVYHSSASRVLGNRKYLGDEFYPAIITEELFQQVSEEKAKRALRLGRTNLIKEKKKPIAPKRFIMKQKTNKLIDPFADAAYLYSLIESEV